MTRGTHELAGWLIWGYGRPTGTQAVCPGRSDTCRADCYARMPERYRAAAARYRRDHALARRRGFAHLARTLLVLNRVHVLRRHVGGDFFSARYAREWLRVMHCSPWTLFDFYTRSWCVPATRPSLDRMTGPPNNRVWFSADRDIGLPAPVPPRGRVAWLITDRGDTPPAGTHLGFRIRRLRRRPATPAGRPVYPAEDRVVRARPVTCDRCGHCWRPAGTGRVPLPVLIPSPPGPGPRTRR